MPDELENKVTESKPEVVESVPESKPESDLEKKVAELDARVKALEELAIKKRSTVQTPMQQAFGADPKVAESEMDILKRLVESEKWPHAVDPTLICDVNSEKDKEERAEGILEIIINTSLENQAFLDFGCGEGHVVNQSLKQKPKVSVGYDLRSTEKWDQFAQEKAVFTKDWSDVVKNGPYNVILAYDVIDHIEGKIGDEFSKLRRVCAPGAKVYVRCHPFCSRHGTHLYHQLNKAYLHLVFTEEEIEQLGLSNPHKYLHRIIHPIAQYNNFFKAAGFKIMHNPQITRENVEKFFTETPLIAKRIKQNWRASNEISLKNGKAFPILQVEQQFLDYVLTI